MAGLEELLQESSPVRNIRVAQPNKELYLRQDGDDAFVTFLTDADEESDGDTWLSGLEIYSFQNGQKPNGDPRWAFLLNDPDVDLSTMPDDARLKKQVAFWVYVHYVYHPTRPNIPNIGDDWEEVQDNRGKHFKETVNDYRIFSVGYGQKKVNLEALSNIKDEWGGKLSKGVVRIKRNGLFLDTTYTFTPTVRDEEAPAPEEALQPLSEYYKENYSKLWSPASQEASTTGESVEFAIEDTNGLPF